MKKREKVCRVPVSKDYRHTFFRFLYTQQTLCKIHERINKRVGEYDECKIISPYAFYMMLFCIVKDALLQCKR
ncbi:MAG: hypothetical protein ACFNL1_06355, partial [Prevotella histicola]